MSNQEKIDFERITRAIEFIQSEFRQQPSLDEIAAHVHLSPFHFQRLFKTWAGVSPKRFLEYTSVNYARRILKEQTSLFDTALETGLSGTSRLHDLFVKIEGMTPGEYKNQGANLNINYSYDLSPFGEILVASTERGICYMGFADERLKTFNELKGRFPNATFIEKSDSLQESALKIYSRDWTELDKIKLHLKATDFQLKVWESLLTIPPGRLTTYGQIANQIKSPKASRAVGTAIGSNPVAFLIPCHRVIQSSGLLGGYMWGETRKRAIIGWEAVRNSSQLQL